MFQKWVMVIIIITVAWCSMVTETVGNLTGVQQYHEIFRETSRAAASVILNIAELCSLSAPSQQFITKSEQKLGVKNR